MEENNVENVVDNMEENNVENVVVSVEENSMEHVVDNIEDNDIDNMDDDVLNIEIVDDSQYNMHHKEDPERIVDLEELGDPERIVDLEELEDSERIADLEELDDLEELEELEEEEKPGGRSRRSSEKKESHFLENLYSIIVLLALIAVFVSPYFMMKRYLPTIATRKSENTSDAKVSDAKKGTYCTYKSNSLDGVPVFAQAGDKNETTLIPEGKYVQFVDACTVNGEEWARVDYCDIIAWLPMKRIFFVTEDAAYIREGSTVYINTETELGIQAYKEASADSEIVADNLLYGTEFMVQDLKDGWGKVEVDGQACWINMYHVGSYGTATWMVNTLSSAGEMNLRAENSEDSDSIGKIPENTVLTIQEFRNGWGYTEYDGQSGWVKLRYLIPVEA